MSTISTTTTPPVVIERDPKTVRNARLKDAATYLLLILACTLTTGPIIFLVATSLKETYTRTVDLSVFLNPTFVNYSKIWNEHPFQDWMRNSLLVATAVTIGILILDSLAGYAFARKRFRGKDTIFFLILATLMVPLPVTLLPIFLLANDLGWIDTYRALIFPALAYPVGVFMMRQFIETIPKELEDAARIDGMSDFGIYRAGHPAALHPGAGGAGTLYLHHELGRVPLAADRGDQRRHPHHSARSGDHSRAIQHRLGTRDRGHRGQHDSHAHHLPDLPALFAAGLQRRPLDQGVTPWLKYAFNAS